MRVPLQRLGSRRQKMSDAETLQAVETVLQALADDEWAGLAMRNEPPRSLHKLIRVAHWGPCGPCNEQTHFLRQSLASSASALET